MSDPVGILRSMSPSPVTITVSGHAERRFAPNRCTVHLRVETDRDSRTAASEQAVRAITQATDLVAALREQDNSPISRWTLNQVHHDRRRPYHRDGKQLPWRYYSSARITVTFHDFAAIGGFIDAVTDIETVTIGYLNWWLTARKTAKKTARVRDLAVLDALAKAKGYTASLGCASFHATAIADPGMLGISTGDSMMTESGIMPAPSGVRVSGGGGEESQSMPDLQPERIVITSAVEARFEAS